MTWTPPPGARPTTVEKALHKEAALSDELVKLGIVSFDGATLFGEYATTWVENEPLAYRTRTMYEDYLRRIVPALGHIKLEKLQARHLEAFYKNLAEPGIKNVGRYATSNKLDKIMKERKLSRDILGRQAGVAAATVSAAARGERVRIMKAMAIASALGMETSKVFTLITETTGLSPKTIHHHHRLIAAILAKAKRERVIPFNVAAEHATAPKLPRTEASYLNDEDAQSFVALLLQESDIRIKTALILLIFTGMRRGELCGLSWSDCDLENGTIHVCRASQWQKGKGIVTVPTKNENSIRDIDVSPFVSDLLREYKTWWTERRLFWGKDWQGKLERLLIQDDGKPLAPDTINYWLSKFLKKHNLPHVSPHGLRHTFATLQITAGVDIRTLQARTGHAQASALINTYSHAIKSTQKQAAAILESVLLPKGENKSG